MHRYWNTNRTVRPSNRVRTSRRGTTMLEVLVSFTLLTTVLTVSTPLLVRHTRLLAGQRQYRLGLDEACNQIERLSALPEPALRKELEKLAISEIAVESLPGATLRGQLDAVDLGHRLTLSLAWGDAQRRAAPIVMCAWIAPVKQ